MSLDLVRSLKWDEKLWEKPRERRAGPTAQSHNSCRFAFFLPPYCRAFCIICSTVHRCISPHQAVLETVVKMSEAFRKTQPKGIWLYAGTTHWLFSMQNKMQRKPIWDALATFLLTTQLCFCQISYFWIRGEQIFQYSNTWDRIVIIVFILRKYFQTKYYLYL